MRLERPTFTSEHNPGTFRPTAGAVYVVGDEIREPRGASLPFDDDGSVRLLRLTHPADGFIGMDGSGNVSLHDSDALAEALGKLPGPIYLDITALEHRTWAPLVRVLTAIRADFRVIYVKPEKYTRASAPMEPYFWDLSDEIEGIAPLPGFIKLRRDATARTKLVPLLGFEGNRLEHILAEEEVDPEDILPIVGSPGFRLEYPVQTVLANQATLEPNFVWSRLEYASASCPFDLYFLLEHLRDSHANPLLLVATIGTKPHALGAVLQAIRHPDTTELIYDHPRRKPNRSSGGGSICVYDVGAFTAEYLVDS